MKTFIIQSILLPTSEYSAEEARRWVQGHGYIASKSHTTKNFHRFRQHTQAYAYSKGCINIRTIPIGDDGIQFIVSYDARQSRASPEETYCDDMRGAGIYDTTKTIIFGRTDYPADQKKLLEKYGSNTITNISVGRTPLPQILTNALNILTLGAFQKILNKSPYDKLYHLFSIITLDNGVKLKIDKTQAINMKVVGNYNPKHTEYITISNIPSGLTLQTAMDNTKKSLGSKFFTYDAVKNNCQLFIKIILSSNNLLTKQSQDFIEQDVREMFKDFQILQKIVHGITAVGTALDIVKKGGYICDEDYDDDDELLGGIRAPFSRYGGKSRIAEQLISMFPNPDKYDVYVEPFLGGGNVFLRKDPYNHKEVINDLDKQVYSVFKKLQSDSKYINDHIKRHTVTKPEWLKLHESTDPANIITSIKWSFMGRNTHYSGTNQPIKTDYLPYQDRLKSVVILNTSYEHVIQKYDSPRTFFYLDPPYNTKTANTDYRTDAVTPLDIYNSVKNVKGFIMISYNNDAEMKRLFKDWNIRFINTKYTNNFILKNKKDKSHKIVKELVITNY